MSRLNYILPRHRTQSRTFAYMINGILLAPDLIWQDVGDLLDPNYLQTLRERERDYIALAYESLVISIFLKKYHVSGCLALLLVRIGFCTTKSDIRQYWCIACFQSHGQMFKLTKHYFLNSIWIRSRSELFFFKGERIQISLKAGHHQSASKTPLNGVLLAQRWMLAW